MVKLKHVAYLFGLMIILVSCKSDKKENEIDSKNKLEKAVDNKNIVNKEPAAKKKIEPIDNGDNLIFTRLLFTTETKLYASALTTGGLTKVFSDPEKKYTVFAPSNDAFKALANDKISALFSDRELLSNNMKDYIVEGDLNYTELSNKIASSGGVASLKSLSGKKLKASLNGSTIIIIKDSKGNEASVIGTENINAENGVIYIIDKLLSLN